ncbi:MAG: hypothetical protein ACLPOO_05155 [Terriglobales bacterium]
MSKVVNAVAPEKRTLNKIRDAARKQGKNRISMREIDKEIKAYRRESKVISEAEPARRSLKRPAPVRG